MRTITTAFLAASLLVGSLIACGGGETPPPNTPPAASASATPTPPASSAAVTPPPAASSAPPAASSAPPVVAEAPKFDSLPKDKKVEIMSTKVVPNVGKDFKDFDAKRFGSFGCATCHGPKKNEDPHKVLPKLTMSGGGYEKMKAKHPEMVKLMEEKVLPDMATALGDKNLKCGACHEVK